MKYVWRFYVIMSLLYCWLSILTAALRSFSRLMKYSCAWQNPNMLRVANLCLKLFPQFSMCFPWLKHLPLIFQVFRSQRNDPAFRPELYLPYQPCRWFAPPASRWELGTASSGSTSSGSAAGQGSGSKTEPSSCDVTGAAPGCTQTPGEEWSQQSENWEMQIP